LNERWRIKKDLRERAFPFVICMCCIMIKTRELKNKKQIGKMEDGNTHERRK
jgi:hypothetical protein